MNAPPPSFLSSSSSALILITSTILSLLLLINCVDPAVRIVNEEDALNQDEKDHQDEEGKFEQMLEQMEKSLVVVPSTAGTRSHRHLLGDADKDNLPKMLSAQVCHILEQIAETNERLSLGQLRFGQKDSVVDGIDGSVKQEIRQFLQPLADGNANAVGMEKVRKHLAKIILDGDNNQENSGVMMEIKAMLARPFAFMTKQMLEILNKSLWNSDNMKKAGQLVLGIVKRLADKLPSGELKSDIEEKLATEHLDANISFELFQLLWGKLVFDTQGKPTPATMTMLEGQYIGLGGHYLPAGEPSSNNPQHGQRKQLGGGLHRLLRHKRQDHLAFQVVMLLILVPLAFSNIALVFFALSRMLRGLLKLPLAPLMLLKANPLFLAIVFGIILVFLFYGQ